MTLRLALLLSLLSLLASLAYPCTARADRIVMDNGDVITGKITRVDRNEVTIDPPYTKAFAVKRDAVASIATDAPPEVELQDGSKTRAQFTVSENGDQQLVAAPPALPATPVAVTAVRKAAPPRAFYARESRIEGTVTFNEGNTMSRSSIINFDTRLRLGDHRQFARVLYRRDESEDTTTKKQTLASYEYDWLFRPAWYAGATATYERDPIRDLGHRFTFGALLGRDLVDAGGSFLTVKAGAGYADESLGETRQAGGVGLWELELRHQLDSARLELVHEHALTYQNYGDNNTILAAETGLRLAVLWDIYATASYLYNYETEPAPGRFAKDSTLAIGLGAKF